MASINGLGNSSGVSDVSASQPPPQPLSAVDMTRMVQDMLRLLQEQKEEKPSGPDDPKRAKIGKDEKQAKEIEELLKKLLQGDIKPEELAKLAKMLGIDLKELEKAKGMGEENNNV
jgi:hypothetical protein